MSSELVVTIKRKYRRQLWPIFMLYRRVRSNPLRTWFQKYRLLTGDATLAPEERRLLKATKSRISFRDGMYKGSGELYYKVGLSAISCIDGALASANKVTVRNVLDLPCGHGRVLRFLISRFPGAKFVGCDIDGEAVGFCESTFGVTPSHSRRDFGTLDLGKTFDLIWCGSLVTHLNAEDSVDLLRFFNQHLSPGGVLVFSTHGDLVARRFEEGKGARYKLAEEDTARMLVAYAEHGFGYADYPRRQEGYGFSLTSPGWVREQLRRIGGWHQVYFGEQEWGNHHDVWGMLKDG